MPEHGYTLTCTFLSQIQSCYASLLLDHWKLVRLMGTILISLTRHMVESGMQKLSITAKDIFFTSNRTILR